MTGKIFFSIILLTFLISCSSVKKDISAKSLYNSSLQNIKKGNLYSAKENLEKIGNDYPYSEYSDKSEVLIGFINYLNKDYEQAAISAETFIKLRPANKYVSYMYFLRAESYFMKRSDFLRGQTMTKKSKNSFVQLVSRFNNSKYHNYAIKSIAKIDNSLAHYHMNIGRTHQKREEYISAIDSFNIVVKKFSNTKFAAEAHFRLVETYFAMGLTNQAVYESKLLKKNHPNSIWIKFLGKNAKTLIS